MNYDHLFKHSAMDQFYVYAYLDPTVPGRFDSLTSTMLAQPFYVGKGRKNRYRVHLSIKGKKHPFYHKIQKLKDAGHEPHTVILASFDTEDDAFAFEVQLIAHYATQNIKLTNLEPGGRIHGPSRLPNALSAPRTSRARGVPRTPDVKQKISQSKLLFHPTAKHWLVISPTGDNYRTKSLRQLIEHQLGFSYNNYKTLINVHLAGRSTVEAGTMKGWQIFELT